MFYGERAQDTRRLFLTSWQKHLCHQVLSPLESQLVDVILMHPEYHALFGDETRALEQAYFPELGETNPFLHMGLHLAIRDQVRIDMPQGIKSIYEQLSNQSQHDNHHAEHQMMDVLAESLWQAQRAGQAPDAVAYLNNCKLIVRF